MVDMIDMEEWEANKTPHYVNRARAQRRTTAHPSYPLLDAHQVWYILAWHMDAQGEGLHFDE